MELCLSDVTGLKMEMWGKQTEEQNLNNSGQLDSVIHRGQISFKSI